MNFEVVSENESGLTIRDTMSGRLWHFMIVEYDGTRELSDKIRSESDDGSEPGIGDDAPPFAFATNSALAGGLID